MLLFFQMILTVFLSNNEQILTEVPITPETTCRDVVEFCKEPGEGSCHLSEVWRGNGKRTLGILKYFYSQETSLQSCLGFHQFQYLQA